LASGPRTDPLLYFAAVRVTWSRPPGLSQGFELGEVFTFGRDLGVWRVIEGSPTG